ncbi:MAG: 3-isopropylmalate dehydrogenase [Propionibacteriaceae bacterium]|jgi:3-isopropylmalate dehydrogenase|nr:3-isopropylmalate dehydrogenase [Propionibacteriaceae bacterium]
MTNIAVIPGDGIGPEIMPEAIKVLNATLGSEAFNFTHYDLGAQRWQRTGEVLPDSVLEELSQADAILLGAVGAAPGSKAIPSGLLERGLLLKIRFSFDQGINLRPSKLYPGVWSPLRPEVVDGKDIDFVVVREGTEGLYCGIGGSLRKGTADEVATEVSVNTYAATLRAVQDAFTRAAKRKNHVTLVHKHNVLTNAGAMWQQIVAQVAAQFPNVRHDYLHIDATTIKMVTDPAFFDVIVTDNLFGDIITDLAAAVTGGIGLAASACINPERKHPSMFEPIHGSAPDIAGQGIADPTATIGSAALLLEHLGFESEAARIQAAVEADIIARGTTKRTTSAVGDAIASLL